jgi:DNA-binding IclR family transcriptional regulator
VIDGNYETVAAVGVVVAVDDDGVVGKWTCLAQAGRVVTDGHRDDASAAVVAAAAAVDDDDALVA